jgi:hypothetical protein
MRLSSNPSTTKRQTLYSGNKILLFQVFNILEIKFQVVRKFGWVGASRISWGDVKEMSTSKLG